jgi:hypothetical protein
MPSSDLPLGVCYMTKMTIDIPARSLQRHSGIEPDTVPGYRRTLRRVGAVLVVMGILDIGLMVYCVMHGLNYSSSVNIFAVIAGILLIRGSLGTVRVITRFLAFFLGAMALGTLILFPFMSPPAPWIVKARLHPFTTILGAAVVISFAVAMVWVYSELRRPEVLEARRAAGQSIARPTSAFALGALVVVVVTVAMNLTLKGEPGQRALQLAQQKEGPSYRYVVTSLSYSGGNGRADVTAYNDHEIKSVTVEW